MNSEKLALEWLKNLSEDEKREIITKQAEERRNRPLVKIEDLTNAEIANLENFRNFCSQKGVEPTKRQAGKSKEEFLRWLNENK